jgi:hypothetical protein
MMGVGGIYVHQARGSSPRIEARRYLTIGLQFTAFLRPERPRSRNNAKDVIQQRIVLTSVFSSVIGLLCRVSVELLSSILESVGGSNLQPFFLVLVVVPVAIGSAEGSPAGLAACPRKYSFILLHSPM